MHATLPGPDATAPPVPTSGPAAVRREATATLRLAAPLIGGQLAMMGLSFLDTVMAGRLGAAPLAAVAVGASVWSAVNLFVIGVLLAVPPFVAEMEGGRRRERVAPFARQAVWLGQGLAVLAVLLLLGARPLLVALHIPAEIVPTTVGYLRGLAWGLPAWCLYLVLRFTSEGLGITRPILYFGLLGLPVDALGNWALMYGRWGLPALGAVGCGHATAVVWTAQAVAMLLYVARRRHYRDLGLLARLEPPDPQRLADLLRVGLPIGVTLFIEGSIFSAVALVLGRLGTRVVAAHQVALNFAALTFMVPLGVSMAITVRVGQALGRRDSAGVRFSAAVGTGLAMTSQALAAAVMLAAPRAVAGLYTRDPEVLSLAVQLLFLAALFQLSDGLQASAAGALRGVRDTRVPMGIVVVAYWVVGLPLGYGLAFGAGLGARGMWMGLIGGLTVAAALLAARFWRVSARLPAPA